MGYHLSHASSTPLHDLLTRKIRERNFTHFLTCPPSLAPIFFQKYLRSSSTVDRPRSAHTIHNGTTTVLQGFSVDSRQRHRILRDSLTSSDVPCRYSCEQKNVALPYCLIRQKLCHQTVLRNGGRAPHILNLVSRWGERSVSGS
jgi:hypothetical protein